jgi:hypothetical protein
MISGLVLKYLNGECFVICGFYKYTLLASTEFNLTVPFYRFQLRMRKQHQGASVELAPQKPAAMIQWLLRLLIF